MGCKCTTSSRNTLDVALELTQYYLDTLDEEDVTIEEIEEVFTHLYSVVSRASKG